MFLPLLISFIVVKAFWIKPQVFRLNCKFKFHLRAALHRGAAGPAGLLFPDFQVCGSRSKTEFFGFAGRRARTAPALGHLLSDFPVQGSRSITEFIGFAGRCARTGLRSDEKRCMEGPGVRASLPTIIFPKGTNWRRTHTLASSSSILIIPPCHLL